MRVRLTVTAIALFIGAFVHAQELVSLTPATAAVPVGGTQVFAVPPNTDLTDVTFFVTPETGGEFDEESLTFTGHAAGEVSVVGRDGAGNDFTSTVKITVQPIKVTAGSMATPFIEGEQRALDIEVRADVEGGAAIANATLGFKAADESVAKIVGMAVVAQDGVKGSKSTTITITSNGVTVGSFPITVLEAIKSITARDLTLQEGKTADLDVRLQGRQGTEFTAAERTVTITPSTNKAFTISPSGVVEAPKIDDGKASTSPSGVQVTIASNETFKREGPAVTKLARVTVVERLGEIRIEPAVLQLPREGSATSSAKVFRLDGAESAGAAVDWTLKNPDDTKWIKLAEDGPKVQIIWNRQPAGVDGARPNVVEVIATSTTGGETVTSTLLVRMSGAVVGFAPLLVRLNLMDDHTVRDLFGARAAGEYFVARVRLNNNIDAKANPELAGSSILAFSESLEVAVVYEKRLVDQKNKPVKEKVWERVTTQDFDDFQAKSEGEPLVRNDPPPQCSDFFTYRPFEASMMINTVDRRDARSTRGRVMTGLQALGTLGSFVTSVAVPGPQSDIPLGLEKYSNLLLPGIEKIWPSLKETHRQNLVSYLMRPLEEIPFGADISRVLFFPKGPFHGLLLNHETRVAQICPFHFKIQVAVIEKKQTVVSGQ